MNRRLPVVTVVAVIAVLSATACEVDGTSRLTFPDARPVDVVDDYHGTPVPDPYRWLEDPDSDETRAWIEAENALTDAFLADIPERERIHERLVELWDYEKIGAPTEAGGRYFYFSNPGLEPQDLLWVTDDLAEDGRVLLDPNGLSEDGTVALSTTAVSRDGALLAYGVSSGGSDWQELFVRDVASGEDLDDHIRWIKFSDPAWDGTSEGFFYARFRAPDEGDELEQANRGHMLYHHRIGTAQEDDVLVFDRPDHPEWLLGAEVTDDGRWLVIPVSVGSDERTMLFAKDLTNPEAEVIPVVDELEAQYDLVGSDGDRLFRRTDLDAPRGRIVALDVRDPDRREEIVGEREEILRSANLVGNRFVASYLKDASSQVVLYDLDGAPAGAVELPGIGTASGFEGRRDNEETFFTFRGFTTPAQVYRLELPAGQATILRAPEVAFDPDDFVTEQVFFSSADGTRVPMFLTHRTDLATDGDNPVILFGYGGFNAAYVPRFSLSAIAWMEMGGVYAVANLRGGGEYGAEWHDAGRLENKQNTFDDFIAAGEWLVSSGYTSPKKLSIYGGSNGGLLVGAVLNQRPDLFGAAVPVVGVMDMLRFHKFTIGWAWVSDYGSPDDPEMFPVLYSYSPYHNIADGACYPPTLIMTADHDDRVVPAHSFKYAARLQAAQGCDEPILIRIETRAGHGAGKPTEKEIEEATDRLAFLVEVMDVNVGF